MKVAAYLGGLWSLLLLCGALFIGKTVAAAGPLWALHESIYIDMFGALMLCLVTFVGFAATLFSATYMRHEVEHGHLTERQVLRYLLWFHLFVITMVAATVVENLGFLWVAIEATTLVSALLVGFYNRRNALEAAWKYVILCGAGIAFAMLGLILLYSAAVRAGIDPLEALRWTKLVPAAGQLDKGSVRMAFALVLLGFGTKAGLAPMHSWLPDAHSQAPSPVSALLSGVLLNTALYAILRFQVIAAGTVGGAAFTRHLLLGFGLVSLGFAVLFILVQRDFKRLLAYSSVEHMGLICIGVGLGGPVGLFGAVLHMIGHAMGKSLLFLSAGNVGHRYHSYRMERIKGILGTLPVTGAILVVAAMAITGAPPTALFVSEFSIVAAGFKTGMAWVAVLTLLGIALAFAGMVLHLREMLLGEAPHGIAVGERFNWGTIPLLLPLVVVVVLGVWIPPYLSDIIRQVAGLLGGGV